MSDPHLPQRLKPLFDLHESWYKLSAMLTCFRNNFNSSYPLFLGS